MIRFRAVAAELSNGTLVGGKFRVTEKLGEGGMGSVYAGVHVDLGQRVAIKVILSGEINDEMLKRFRREALVLAQLESEHAVRVFDYGTLPDGAPYLVMEFLKGQDLQAYVSARGPITVEEAAEIGTSVCDALGDAHSKGIVHRDLKPSNLFLAERPNGRRFVKVLDFGLSLFRPEGQELITKTHAVLGTPLYAAPEQFNASRDADGRADVWSLGASLYELVTGRVPFPAADVGGARDETPCGGTTREQHQSAGAAGVLRCPREVSEAKARGTHGDRQRSPS
ncbi:MAG: serine/threonine-protein kinase [Polyangiaceae bacterium]